MYMYMYMYMYMNMYMYVYVYVSVSVCVCVYVYVYVYVYGDQHASIGLARIPSFMHMHMRVACSSVGAVHAVPLYILAACSLHAAWSRPPFRSISTYCFHSFDVS